MRATLLLLLAACIPAPQRPATPEYAFTIESTFTADERTQIENAASQWNARTFPSMRITFRDDGKWRVEEEPMSHGWNGEVSRNERRMWIQPDPIGATVFAVAIHEFGHVLGLEHTSVGVMDPYHVTTEFSVEDMAECRRVGACP